MNQTSSTWRFSNRELAHIAYAMQQLSAQDKESIGNNDVAGLPQKVFGHDSYTHEEFKKLAERLVNAANISQKEQ